MEYKMEEKFLNFVAQIMEIQPEEISMDTEYKVFPKWDSLMMMNLIMEIEEEYNTVIPIEQVGNIKKLGDLFKLLI